MKLNNFKQDYILPFFFVISEENVFISISYAHLVHTNCMFSNFIAWLTVFIQLITNVPIKVRVSVPVKVTVFWYVLPYSPGIEITSVSEELIASSFS
jgi:hypothetical protein